MRERAFRPFPIEPAIRQTTRQSIVATVPFAANARARRATRTFPRRRLGRANRVYLLRGELIQHRVRGGEQRRSSRVTRVHGCHSRTSRGDANGRRERRVPSRRLLGRDTIRHLGRDRNRRAEFAEEFRDGVLGVVRHVKELGGRRAAACGGGARDASAGNDAESVEGGGAGAVPAEPAPSADARGGGAVGRAFGGVGVGSRRAAGREGGFLAGNGDARVEDGDVPGGGRGGGGDEGDALAELRDAAARATAAPATAAARAAAVLGRIGGARLLAAALVHGGRK